MSGGFVYEQRTGRFLLGSGACAWPVPRCYAGVADGLNAPAMEHVRNIGPVPRGHYRIERRFHPHFAAPSFYLDPSEETRKRLAALGRSGFYVHGDNGLGNRSASRGCIIMERHKRQWLATMIDEGLAPAILVVVDELPGNVARPGV